MSRHFLLKLFPCICAMAIATVPFSISAHQTGTSYEEVIGGAYKVDIGYDPAQPTAADRIVFDFNLRKIPDLDPVQFDYVWVRILHDKETLLATGIAQSTFGPTSLLYFIPENMAGTLTVNVRYEKGDKTIAETSFPLNVARAGGTIYASIPWIVGSIGLLFGVACFSLTRRRLT